MALWAGTRAIGRLDSLNLRQLFRSRPARGPIQKFDSVKDGDLGDRADLHHAADVSRGDNLGRGCADIGKFAGH